MSTVSPERHRVDKLVYYEVFDDPYAAISREKQIKPGSRADKERLIGAITCLDELLPMFPV